MAGKEEAYFDYDCASENESTTEETPTQEPEEETNKENNTAPIQHEVEIPLMFQASIEGLSNDASNEIPLFSSNYIDNVIRPDAKNKDNPMIIIDAMIPSEQTSDFPVTLLAKVEGVKTVKNNVHSPSGARGSFVVNASKKPVKKSVNLIDSNKTIRNVSGDTDLVEYTTDNIENKVTYHTDFVTFPIEHPLHKMIKDCEESSQTQFLTPAGQTSMICSHVSLVKDLVKELKSQLDSKQVATNPAKVKIHFQRCYVSDKAISAGIKSQWKDRIELLDNVKADPAVAERLNRVNKCTIHMKVHYHVL